MANRIALSTMMNLPEEIVEKILQSLYSEEATFGAQQPTILVCRQWFRIGYQLLHQQRILFVTNSIGVLPVPRQAPPIEFIGIVFSRRYHTLDHLVSTMSRHALNAVQHLTLDISSAQWPSTTACKQHRNSRKPDHRGRVDIMSETLPLRLALKHMTHLQSLTLRIRETEHHKTPPRLVILLLQELPGLVRRVEVDIVASAECAVEEDLELNEETISSLEKQEHVDRINAARVRFRQCGRYDIRHLFVFWYGVELV